MSLEIAWAAGLFEGEGSFHLTQGNSPQVNVRMTDRDVVEHFHRAIGFGTFYEHPMKNPRHKDQYGWRVTGWVGFAVVVEMIGPYLGERRRAKISEIEAVMPRPMPLTQAMRTHCRRGHPYDEENTRVLIDKKGRRSRQCITCNRDYSRERRRRKSREGIR